MKRVGYTIHVLNIDTSQFDGRPTSPELFDVVSRRYPRHTFSRISISQVVEYLEDELLSITALSGSLLGDRSDQEKLEALLGSVSSTTSRSDILASLRTRLIAQYAKDHTCDAILWGDTTSRLAEKTLGETAKGRGLSLPWLVSDGVSPFGIFFSHPLRDILRSEIKAYAEFMQPPLSELTASLPIKTHVSASAKGTTIDDLMNQYFGSVEENFPSIVANVVRTTGKLRPLVPSADNQTCIICGMPVDSAATIGQPETDRAKEDTISSVLKSGPASERLCNGCSISMK
ncbi:MAG: hypothetical protein M1825_003419 [Sarcosagium campestre]|nr:MAG: hypothetical protein M1825_003419 [Sarcosagium campestre]